MEKRPALRAEKVGDVGVSGCDEVEERAGRKICPGEPTVGKSMMALMSELMLSLSLRSSTMRGN